MSGSQWVWALEVCLGFGGVFESNLRSRCQETSVLCLNLPHFIGVATVKRLSTLVMSMFKSR
eukprot:5616111-Amphidinium_carterae.1